MKRIVVVGASAAGLTAAEALRRRGWGGDLTLIGEEPHPPYDRPPLSKQILTGAWKPERATLRSLQDLARLEADLRFGQRATALDVEGGQVRLGNDESIGFDGLIIATGVTPGTFPTVISTESTSCARSTTLSAYAPRCSPGPGWSWSAPGSSAPKSPRQPGPWAWR